ncbi:MULTISPECIES: protein-L-isoaspartate O-methyltransferase family protein [Burkholderiaceae]|uniref:Protein-L-isoaspartate O-methyltransferase n=1 Tax=Caballeronia sordidicola TaxID=196367 RepID=A0A242N3I2_CABSO|nr:MULTISPECIES: protein-L-isoaspartate(D-aspartate) O-methyltransferase [Burkholderiaceae]OTP78132.1 Protein-L-isoaspartate O-methyltransferase [Caballeronia sordidicola]
MTNVEALRAFYARYITAKGACRDPRIQDAFAMVEREKYLGPGPWNAYTLTGYVSTDTSDPAVLYQDILIGLKTDQGINNGEPSLHARCLDAAAISPGETITHIGSGTGYYTALLALLTGEAGRVTAYEINPGLGAHATSNLAHLAHVRVLDESGADAVLPRSDLIYVSAGATHPLNGWIEALNEGGRLIFPLTPNRGLGGMLLVTRVAADSYAAKFICPATFIECIGARDDATGESLVNAFESNTHDAVKSLRRKTPADQSAWFVGDGWWLSTSEPLDAAD